MVPMNEVQAQLIRESIREHNEQLHTVEPGTYIPPLGVEEPGPMRTLVDDDDNPIAIVVARPEWWDNPADYETSVSFGKMAGVPVWLIRYDPETLEPVGEPEVL